MRCAAAAQQALRMALAATGSGRGSAARAPCARAGQPPLLHAAACALERRLCDARRHASAVACFPASCGRRGARRRAALQPVEAAGGSQRGGKAQPPPSRAPPGAVAGAVNFNRKRTRLAIKLYPDPCLRAPNADITEFDAALKLLVGEMFDLMYRTDGMGLAAPQVGVNKRLMVYNEEGVRGLGQELVLCNPVLVEASKEEGYFEEGCLSFPEIYADVKRPITVKVEFQDVTGAKQRMALDELQARVFLHEFDHLQSVLFHDRMEPEVLATVQPQLDALEAAYAANKQAQ